MVVMVSVFADVVSCSVHRRAFLTDDVADKSRHSCVVAVLVVKVGLFK